MTCTICGRVTAGFLSLSDHIAPGNYALFDLVASLHYIRENVAAFGGDADQVTVMGDGYAAALLNLLLVSPVAKGQYYSFACQTHCKIRPQLRGRAEQRPADRQVYTHVAVTKETICKRIKGNARVTRKTSWLDQKALNTAPLRPYLYTIKDSLCVVYNECHTRQ